MPLLIITVFSLMLAATMSVVAWRAVSAERHRSEARVAHLSAEIRGDGGPLEIAADPMAAPPTLDIKATAVLAVCVVCLLATIGVVLSPRLWRVEPVQASSPSIQNKAVLPSTSGSDVLTQADGAPLELVALHHEREADQLTIRGVIRNPATGTVRDHLVAIVLLFDPDGGFISSTRANVAAATLAPGSETTFAVTVPNAAGVGRYRVSFRTDNRVVPHIDRRT